MVVTARRKLHPKCRIASGPGKIYFWPVKHSGKASGAASKLIGLSALILVALLAAAFIGKYVGTLVLGMAGTLVAIWALFVIFTFYLFRDPAPAPPMG
jgi:hypothetical protein